MWFLSGVGKIPTPNVCSDVWNHVESYTIRMLLVCRLKIIPTSNLKLIISFLVLFILVLSSKSCYHLLPQLGMLHLTLCVYLRLDNRPNAPSNNWLEHDVKSVDLPQCINNSIQPSNNDASTNQSNQYEMRRDNHKKFATLSCANAQFSYWPQLTLTLRIAK